MSPMVHLALESLALKGHSLAELPSVNGKIRAFMKVVLTAYFFSVNNRLMIWKKNEKEIQTTFSRFQYPLCVVPETKKTVSNCQVNQRS